MIDEEDFEVEEEEEEKEKENAVENSRKRLKSNKQQPESDKELDNFLETISDPFPITPTFRGKRILVEIHE